MNGTVVDAILEFQCRRTRPKGGYRTIDTSAGNLRYVDTGGDKTVVLMTPDAPCTIEHHADIIEELSSDFRVVCFEMPGSGGSFPRAGYSFTVAETSDAILEFIDQLNIQCVILNFTCFNGMHALNFSSRFSDRVSHLVLAQVPSVAAMKNWTDCNIPRPLRVPFVGQILGRVAKQKLSDKWFSVSLPRPSEYLEKFKKISKDSFQSGGCFCLASIVQGALRSPETDMLGTHHPTIMIYGKKDYSHRQTDFTRITDTVPSARVLEFDSCGHFPNLERPKLFADALRNFVK